MSTVISGNKLTRLLYVDDELDILNIVQKGLALYGFSVDISSDPREVLAKDDLSQYDLIVLDLRMPKMSGFDLYEELKPRIDRSKTKICFFTAFTSYLDEYHRRFPQWNGGCFMTKPVSMKLMAEKLRMLLATNGK
jgi:two-component system catabolic regulation response regulator CreB/two-component system response regulator ChvI